MRQTSLIANRAAENSGIKQTHYRKILEALSKHKRGTSYHISQWANLEYHSVARRMSELERDLKVMDLGKTGRSPSGLPATVWEII